MRTFKNTTSTLVLLTLLVSTASAQFSIGLRGGIHLANWAINDDLRNTLGDPEIRLSPVVGAVMEIRFTDNIALQPEMIFLQKGFKQENSYSDPILGAFSSRFDMIINHIEVPVLFKAGGVVGPLRMEGLVGPGLSVALTGKRKTETVYNGVENTDTRDIDFHDDEFSRIDFSIHAGAVFSLKLGEVVRVFLDSRYLLGLTNINTSDSADAARNRGISISTGVLFTL